MNLKQAIEKIEKAPKLGVMRVYNYPCEKHKKVHKYSFHSRITFCPGTERFFGFDTAKEVIKFAKDNTEG